VSSSNEIGRRLEQSIVDALGGRFVKQSGGGAFEKLDVKDDAKFVYFARATTRISEAGFRAIWRIWTEAKRGTRGPAGHGNEAKPACVFEMNGELLVLTRLADHVAIVTGEIAPYVQPSKAQERRARAIQNPRTRTFLKE
jgi:hypothetical protein